MNWITTSPTSMLLAFASAVGIYAALIALTRVSGLRSFSKMSGFDFAITVAIGSIIASTVMAKTPPLAMGIAALAILFILQMSIAALRARFATIRQLLDNSPRLIMVRRTVLQDQLRAAKMTECDLWSKLREANVLSLDQVEAVIAEATGDVSVLHHDGKNVDVSDELLRGVIGAERYRSTVQKSKRSGSC